MQVLNNNVKRILVIKDKLLTNIKLNLSYY
jgi:hypothetical protein